MIWGGGLTGSAVGVGIPGFFMEFEGTFRGYHPDKRWDFTIGWGKRVGMDRCKWRKGEEGHIASGIRGSRGKTVQVEN